MRRLCRCEICGSRFDETFEDRCPTCGVPPSQFERPEPGTSFDTLPFDTRTPSPADDEPETVRFDRSWATSVDRLAAFANRVDAMVGRQIGRYRIVREIGRGGMGVVYEAIDAGLQRPVALKVMSSGRFASPDEVRRFRREAAWAGKVEHPNIVPIYEVDEHEGQVFYAMRLIEGANLARRGPEYRDNPAAAAQLLVTTCRAVAAAHRAGVIHRDLKPANILIDRLGQPYVTDFGLATEPANPEDLTASGVSLGTPGYASPELAEGRRRAATEASDVYGLGVILYDLLTGRPPFLGDTVLETLRQVIEDEPVAPDRLDPGIDRDLATICMTCLRKEPGRRYQSADALAEDLVRWLERRPILARPTPRSEKFVMWIRREPRTAALLGLLFAVGLAGVCGVIGLWRVALGERDLAFRANSRLADELADRRDQAYAYRMIVAHQDYRDGHLGQVHQALDGERPAPGGPDRRGFEWHYLHRLCHSSLATIEPGLGRIYAVAYSPDGRTLATGQVGGSIAVVDAETGAFRCVLPGHEGGTRSVEFHPNGRLLASAGHDNSARIWDIETGEEVHVFRGINDRAYYAATFSADGTRVAITGLDRFQIYRLSDGEKLVDRAAHPGGIRGADFSPDGTRIATCGLDGKARLFDARTGEPLLELIGHEQIILSIEFSPDGSRLLTASRDQTARIWSVADGRELKVLRGHDGDVFSATFRPDGRVVATVGYDRVVRLWDASSGKALREYRGHRQMICDVAFHPDGRRIVTVAFDDTARVWDSEASPESRPIAGHGRAVWSLAFGAGGRQILSGSHDGTVAVWDADTGDRVKVLGPIRTEVDDIAPRPDGKAVVVAGRDGIARVLDLDSGETLALLDPGPDRSQLRGVAYSPDGALVATVGISDRVVRLWDAGRATLIRVLLGHQDGVDSVAFSPDGRLLATGSDDGEIRIWDVETGTGLAVLKGHEKAIHDLAFSPDGRRLAGACRDGCASIWDVDGQRLIRYLEGHDGYVLAVAYSADGRRIVTGGEDRTARFWEAESGRELLILKGHAGVIDALALSDDGRFLVAAGGDGVLQLWETLPDDRAPCTQGDPDVPHIIVADRGNPGP